MAVMFLRCKVKNNAQWKQSFDEANPISTEAGITDTTIHQDLEFPNVVTVCKHFEDADRAKAYAAQFKSEEVQEAVKQGGAIEPIITWLAKVDTA